MAEMDNRDAEMWRSVAWMWMHLVRDGDEDEPWLRQACFTAHEAAEAANQVGMRELIAVIRRAEERRWTRAN
jgi:hypothetical protein